MEELSEAHSEDNKVSQDNNKKRRLKTPGQVMALEKFYNEHKYPTEEMKSALAEELGLTEKQISGWFCHRRLKDKKLLRDEKFTNGRQDRSSGIIQDRGSGLGQDSCGSTKNAEYRHVDPREVESRRLYGHDFPTAELSHDQRSHYTERVSGVDNTSSESSSSLQDRLFSQSDDPYDMETSRYLKHDGVIAGANPKVSRNMGYKPSGYLKVKGEIENAAVTAVKRQLGRHYREDGPPLAVEFEPLPPGAFESPGDPGHERYYVENSVLPDSPDISGVKRQPSPSTRYEVYNSKVSSKDSYVHEAPMMHVFEGQEIKSGNQSRKKSTYLNRTSSLPGRNSTLNTYDESGYNRNSRMSSKHGVEGMISDSALKHHGQYSGKISREQSVPWLDEDNNTSPKILQRSEYSKLKPSVSKRYGHEMFDMKDRRQSKIMAKAQEDIYNEEAKATKEKCSPVKVKMKPTNEMMAGKKVMVDCSQQDYGTNSSIAPLPPRSHLVIGSTMEMPSSFSEDDETAETSSSVD
ncbi:homeobox-DDT domain protein RLT1 [Ziziphus jujuba]|uniref:Homeobox-DDT domain protein RLT1 n=1 Tax=Ziziphus jujuba TaxID=326968 RepID=A0A6P3Z2E8_ZIZJJ|nr:homeobox-DDT domain protein RLT1 [Ziziphus jujuba]